MEAETSKTVAEMTPEELQVRILKKGLLHVAVPLERVEPLTTEAVRQTQLTLRERRKPF